MPTVEQANKIIKQCEDSITISLSKSGRKSNHGAGVDEIKGGLVPTSERSDRFWEPLKDFISQHNLKLARGGGGGYQLTDGILHINDSTGVEWKCRAE